MKSKSKWTKEYRKEYDKKYRESHKEHLRKLQKKYLQKPKYKKYQKEYQKEYYQKNKTKLRKYSREYLKNYQGENQKEYQDEYYQKNKQKISKRQKKYIKNKYKKDKNFNIIVRLRSSIRYALKYYTKTGKILSSRKYGIDYQAIIEHLKPFPENMSDFHIDHIKPLCLFNLEDPEEIKKAFDPENHQWLTIQENQSKGSKFHTD